MCVEFFLFLKKSEIWDFINSLIQERFYDFIVFFKRITDNCFFSFGKKIYFLNNSICPIITHEPLDRFASNFDWRTRENHEIVLNMEILSWLGQLWKGKLDKIVDQDQTRVNGGSMFEYPGDRNPGFPS